MPSVSATAHRYGSAFFDYVDATSGRSAAALIGRLDLGFTPRSILDVGCGRGIWLAAWKAAGVAQIQGLDGAYVDPARLRIAPGEFTATDLARPFDLGRRFDLVECLEVAEHLEASAAAGFVESLVRHADVILFSAAPPGQGGEHHVNEQPAEHWIGLFAACGYAAYDCVRPAIRGRSEIEPWYRYNTLLFASEAGAERLSGAARATRVAPGSRPREYGSLAWRLRLAALRTLPRPMIEWLARVQHARWG
ncbi:MAG: methyltransferase domain-containing protein [Anaeromyxobacteraceae bacterium]